MQREWKIFTVFVGLFAAVPFIHEYIHAFTSITLGYPSWIVWGWGKFVASYSFDTLPVLWIRLVIRYSPELVFLPIAAMLTWKFRNRFELIFVVPLLLVSIMGFLGHARHIG